VGLLCGIIEYGGGVWVWVGRWGGFRGLSLGGGIGVVPRGGGVRSLGGIGSC